MQHFEERCSKLEKWLSKAVCASQQRVPNPKSADEVEKKWARWIHNVRQRKPKHIVERLNNLLVSRGCKRKGKRVAGLAPSMIPLSPLRLTRQSSRLFEKPVAASTAVVAGLPQDQFGRSAAASTQMIQAPSQVVGSYIPRPGRRDAEARFIQCYACRQLGRNTWRRVGGVAPAANASLIWMLDDLYSIGEQIKLEHPQVLAVLLDDTCKFMLYM